MGKVILYIATSQDGFIADIKGEVDWLPQPAGGDDFGYQALLDQIDTIVMGSKSYLQILSFGDWAWAGKKTFIFTSQNLKTDREDIFFTSETPQDFMKEQRDKNIWLLGGAELAKNFSEQNLIDEYIITIVPKELGQGIKLDIDYNSFTLANYRMLDGIVQSTYIKFIA